MTEATINYCEHHLGDYAKRTGAFTMLEHGAYAKLRDRYFVTEAPIPLSDVYRQAGARSSAEREAVDIVLAEFYRPDGALLRCDQFDAEIEKAQAKIRAAKENGKLGGRPKRTEDEPIGNQLGFVSVTQTKALQTPDTRHQPTVSEKPRDSSPKGESARTVTLKAKDLVSEGIDPQVADDWMAVRKAKKAPLTQSSWEAVKREAAAAGLTPAEAVRIAAESNWQGFKASWLQRDGLNGHGASILPGDI